MAKQSTISKPTIPNTALPDLQSSLTEIDLEHFPTELQSPAHPYWLIWQPIPNNYKDSSQPITKVLKKPVNPAWQQQGQTLIWEDVLDVYNNFQQNVNRLRQTGKNVPPPGFGFVYNESHPFICIDIDDATDENNELVKILNSYTEWSPSGKGLHVIIQVASLLEKAELIQTFGTGKRNLKCKRDLFISTGYVTVTGKQIPITPSNVATISLDDLTPILHRYFLSSIIPMPSKQEADAKQAEAFQEAINKNQKQATTKKDTKSAATAKQGLQSNNTQKALTVTQVKALLARVPVKCLESDIFDRLYGNEMAIIDLDCEEEARQPWLIIGQALHHNFNGRIEGYYLWDAWSQEGDKYDATACVSTWDSFKNQTDKPVTIAALIKLANAQRPIFPDVTGNGAKKGTVANFHTYVDFYKFDVFHNEITKEAKVKIPEYVLKRWRTDSLAAGQELSLTEIAEYVCSDLVTLGFSPSAFSNLKVRRFLTAMGKSKSYNPIRDYFKSCGEQWDGNDYIDKLLDTIEVSPFDKQYLNAYRMFLRKWLIQVLAAACHPATHPVRLNRVLIFSGPQSIGKTRWVESLFPAKLRRYCAADKELRLSNFRTDNVKQTMELSSTLICNINEIDRLFKLSTFSDFKAFLDQTSDRIVLPYGDSPTEVTRRTVFIGSTNQSAFLKDTTGNRRFEIIHAIKLDFRHNLPIDQLWGQIYHLYKAKERWWLDENNPDELKIIRQRDAINSRSMYIGNDSLIEQLEDVYDVDTAIKNDDWQKLTFKDIRMTLGLSHLTTNSKAFNHAKRAIHLWSKQVSDLEPVQGKGTRPATYYFMPPVRTEAREAPVHAELDTDPADTQTQIKELEEQMLIMQARMNKLKKSS